MPALSARGVADEVWDAVMEVCDWANEHGIPTVGTDKEWFQGYCQALYYGEVFYDPAVVRERFEVLIQRLSERAEEVERERGDRQ